METVNTEPPAASVTTETVYFWTRGEDMTRRARDFCREGNPDMAAKLLVEGIGMSWDQAYELLAGKTRLDGNTRKKEDGGAGGMWLESDGPENEETAEYLEDIQNFYCGRYRYGENWFRPVAYVTGLDARDMKAAYTGTVQIPIRTGGKSTWGDLPLRRAMFYSHRPTEDQFHLLRVPGTVPDANDPLKWVIFERTNAPPPWLRNPNNNDPEKALRDWFCNGRRLEPRGPDTWGAPEDEVEDWDDVLSGAAQTFNNLSSGRTSDPVAQAGELKIARALDRRLRDEAIRERDGLPPREETEFEREARTRAEETLDQILRQEREESEDEREARYKAKLAEYRAEIRQRAEADDGGGYFTLTVKREEGDDRPTQYQVPRYPFEAWALWRTNLRHLAPKWPATCESGLKMYNDDPLHSDWMLGAEPEVPLDSWHGFGSDDAFGSAAFREQFRIQERIGKFQVSVMCGTGVVQGTVIHPEENQEVPEGSVIVIPHAGPAYAVPAMSAGPTGAIITEKGGQLSHLSTVGREMGLKMVRIENALTLYRPDASIEVDLNRGRVTLTSRNVRGMLGEYE